MNKATRLLIKKLFFQITQTTTLRSMLLFCCISIAIGSFSLTLVAAIMQGFEQETHKKLQGIHTDIIMQHPRGSYIAAKAIQNILTKEFYNDIESATPYSYAHVLVQGQHTTNMTVAQLYGINPETEKKTSSLAQSLYKNKKMTLSELLSEPYTILIGTTCAQQIGIKNNDTCTLSYMLETKTRKKRRPRFEQEEVSVTGQCKTGVDEFDARALFCSQETFQELFPNSGTKYIGIKKKPNVSTEKLIKKLENRFHLDVFSWKSLYPSLVSALTLEKYAMFAILALITLIASMNIIALLAMFITHKKKTIAILQSLGMPHRSIAQIFTIIGITITAIASSIGTIIATGASFLLDTYQLIPLPDAYYTSYLPAKINGTIIASVIILSIVLGCIASYLATRTINHIDISQELKFRA